MSQKLAYPLGVTGIILSLIFLRVIFKVSFDDETKKLNEMKSESLDTPKIITIKVQSKAIDGKNLSQIRKLIGRQFVVSRLLSDGIFSIPNGKTILKNGDIALIVTTEADAEAVIAFTGDLIEYDWKESDNKMISRRRCR